MCATALDHRDGHDDGTKADTGVHRRRKPDAVEEFRQMKDGAESRRRDRERGQGGRRNRRMPARPKPLTPSADLPEELR